MNTKIVLAISLLLAAGASANAVPDSPATDSRYKRVALRASYAHHQSVPTGPVLVGQPSVGSRNCTYQGGPKTGTWACR